MSFCTCCKCPGLCCWGSAPASPSWELYSGWRGLLFFLILLGIKKKEFYHSFIIFTKTERGEAFLFFSFLILQVSKWRHRDIKSAS